MSTPDYSRLRKELERTLAPDRVLASPEAKITYSYDASRLAASPDLVVRPLTTEEVAAVMRVAYAHGAPVTARGAGSGLTGGSVPAVGGIVVDFLLMSRILDIDPVSGTAIVQPGVLVDELQAALAPYGMFYAPDPGSSAYATIGGNIAENAGGMRAVKYGVTRDSILALTCVLADGAVIRTGSRAHKCVAGFDLTRLICGSEGMLALVTEAAVKILPIPKHTATVLAHFACEEDALNAAARVCAEGALPRALEFIDGKCIEVLLSQKTDAPVERDARALILCETDGSTADAANGDMQLALGVLEKYGAGTIARARDDSERAAIWNARKTLASALYNVAPVKLNEDVCAPRARLAEFVARTRLEADARGLFYVNYGHVGDGNLHSTVMLPDNRPETLAPANELVEIIFRTALELGGTISGEHGIGLTKRKYLPWEVGERELALMCEIKRLFDPKGILNPGKQW
jgi:glycolate oxidase